MSEVWFRGPMLFLTKNGNLQEIRIPDASILPASWRHPDGDPAGVHFAGLLITDGAGGELHRFNLRGTTVTIAGGRASACAASLGALPDLSKLTDAGGDGALSLLDPGDLTFPARCAARLFIKGGALADTGQVTLQAFEVPAEYASGAKLNPVEMPLAFQWTPMDANAYARLTCKAPCRPTSSSMPVIARISTTGIRRRHGLSRSRGV
ncbi:hypothetical protein BH09GEM1_BH09GEM1_14240 [soil metagenome]